MCGLFGIIRPGGTTVDDELALERLGDQLRHRGPDGSGYIRERAALLGMHRLSIMDPAHGWQPFWSEDGRWGVLGNGEIYNAAALRHGLQDRGHRLTTGSDIEVVPHLVEEHGLDAFVRLRGMFALLVIDRQAGEVLLARDRLGEKPLAYWSSGDALFIASEQGALVRAGIVPVEIDRSLLGPYLLHGYTPEPRSLIAGVRKVPAAHVVRIRLSDGDITDYRYWNPIDAIGDAELTDADLTAAIEDAIVSTCTSDVPVGIALSGGLDSSMVAAIATRARTDLHAFTIGYSTSGHDESALAQDLAARLGIPCHTTILHTDEIAGDFARVCGARDEPISDIAGPALSAVPRAAHEAGVPVLLTGIGGDELFWGYDWIRQLAAWMTTYLAESAIGADVSRARFTPQPANLQARVDWVLGVGGRRTDGRMRSFVAGGARAESVPLPFYQFQPGHATICRAMGQLLGAGAADSTAEFRGSPRADLMGALYTIASNDTYLRVNSFVQVDRLAMQYSSESRTPLADGDLVAKVLSGRLRSRDHFAPPKARMRELARGILPDDVIRRPKRGFTPPVRDWVRAIWARNAEAQSGSACVELAGMPASTTARWMASPVTRSGRVSQVALRLLTLELWLRSLA